MKTFLLRLTRLLLSISHYHSVYLALVYARAYFGGFMVTLVFFGKVLVVLAITISFIRSGISYFSRGF